MPWDNCQILSPTELTRPSHYFIKHPMCRFLLLVSLARLLLLQDSYYQVRDPRSESQWRKNPRASRLTTQDLIAYLDAVRLQDRQLLASI